MIDLEKINALFDNASEVQEQEPPSEELRQIENALKPKFFEAQRTEDIFREYQENSLKASQGMKEILQGAEYGVSLYNLFFKALEVIESMTNDGGVFTESVKRKMQNSEHKENFAEELNRAEHEMVSTRLERLKTALQGASGDDRLRIENSIREHERKIAELKRLSCKNFLPERLHFQQENLPDFVLEFIKLSKFQYNINETLFKSTIVVVRIAPISPLKSE